MCVCMYVCVCVCVCVTGVTLESSKVVKLALTWVVTTQSDGIN